MSLYNDLISTENITVESIVKKVKDSLKEQSHRLGQNSFVIFYTKTIFSNIAIISNKHLMRHLTLLSKICDKQKLSHHSPYLDM